MVDILHTFRDPKQKNTPCLPEKILFAIVEGNLNSSSAEPKITRCTQCQYLQNRNCAELSKIAARLKIRTHLPFQFCVCYYHKNEIKSKPSKILHKAPNCSYIFVVFIDLNPSENCSDCKISTWHSGLTLSWCQIKTPMNLCTRATQMIWTLKKVFEQFEMTLQKSLIPTFSFIWFRIRNGKCRGK